MQQTYIYKKIGDLQLKLDVLLPETFSSEKLGGFIYFHGGGLTVGNRNSYFPQWLADEARRRGFAFMTVDYRLIPPATGFDILDDVLDLFAFINTELNRLLSNNMHGAKVDLNSLVAAGSSAGGLCVYLAAVHVVHPKLKCIVSLYGMGGDFMTHHYLSVKHTPFFRGREILNPLEFGDFLYPQSLNLPDTADSPLSYFPNDSPRPGYPSNPRILLARLLLQMGVFLDYYTGLHSASLSARLRAILEAEGKTGLWCSSIIPESCLALFPQFNVTSEFPPTLFIHGEVDSAVLPQESQNIYNLLEAANVKTRLIIVEGKEHSFDFAPGLEVLLADLSQDIFRFVSECV